MTRQGALLTGLLLGTGAGAMAGWPIGLGVGGALTAILLMQSFIPELAARGDASSNSAAIPDGVEIYHLSDPLLIDRVSTFLETLRRVGQRPRVLILDLTGLDWIDDTTLRIINQTLDRESGSGMLVLVAGRGPLTTETLVRSKPLPESVVFDSLDDAVQRARIHLTQERAT